MYTHVTYDDFYNAFQATRPNNFTLDGLEALFDYLEDLEDDTGEPMEFDMIATCIDFTEYESLAEFQDNYGDDYQTFEDIQEMTTLIEFGSDGHFIIQAF